MSRPLFFISVVDITPSCTGYATYSSNLDKNFEVRLVLESLSCNTLPNKKSKKDC